MQAMLGADRKTAGRESIAAGCQLDHRAGANAFLAMDLHAAQIQGYSIFLRSYGSPVVLLTWRINNYLILLLFHRMPAAWHGARAFEKLMMHR